MIGALVIIYLIVAAIVLVGYAITIVAQVGFWAENKGSKWPVDQEIAKDCAKDAVRFTKALPFAVVFWPLALAGLISALWKDAKVP